ncbi:MAG: PAS domain S-box protein [Williamsia sp.]|nr:PAS domain S-box protein [Williamsia sp.]
MINPLNYGQKADQQFEALFNHASMGIIIVDQTGDIILANDFAYKQFGYKTDELTGKRIELLIPARFHRKHLDHRKHYQAHLKNRPMGVGMDLYAIRKDSTEFPVEISLGHYEIEGNTYVMAFVSDITLRKEQEKAILHLNAELEIKVSERTHSLKETLEKLELQFQQTQAKDSELRKANSYLSNILDHAGAMIIVADRDGIIKLFNRAAEENLGYKAHEVIDKTDAILFDNEYESEKGLPGQTNSIYEWHLSPKGARPHSNQQRESELTFVRKDGSRFPVSISFSALSDVAGTVSGYMVIAVDITERRKTEKEMLQALEREKELGELKSRFVSMASHEFRTPLSTILSSVFLLSKYVETEDQPKREKHIDRIISSVNMLSDILNDFLSIGKIEEGKIQVRWSEFDLPVFMEAIFTETRGMLKAGQEISYIHQGISEVTLDPSLVKHIMLNLLSNAVKFSPPQSLIEVSTAVTGAQVLISIKDHGMGISKEDLLHLFERFFRGTNVSNIQGTGLGLHIVAKYAELMNGHVQCSSELEKGTEFIVTFNRIVNDEEDIAYRRQ